MSEILRTMADEHHLAAENQINANDMVQAKHIGDVLARHYPGHAWMVHVDGKQGIAIVRNQMLNGQWGYVIRLTDIISASDLDRVAMLAGGEILERFKLRRGAFDGESWAGLPLSEAGTPMFFKD